MLPIVANTEKMKKEEIKDSLYFLLKDKKGNLLATGQVIFIEPVIFDQERFSICGIGGIIANIKRQGYGRIIMNAIKQYLLDKHKIGVGFCGKHNKIFYEKSGFGVDCSSIGRLVYYDKSGKRVTEKGDDCVIYLDSSDRFMKKVLAKKDLEVLLPRRPNW